MCSRFYSDEEIAEKILQMAGSAEQELELPDPGDFYPSQMALILSGRRPGFYAETMRWGFPRFDKKGLLINARAETAPEKRSFQEGVLHHRCVIPARRFYEWDKEKNKVAFYNQNKSPLFMAGFYRRFEEGDRFIIVTTETNESMSPVHDRMPLILPESQLDDWIYDQKEALAMLRQPSPMLQRFMEEEQLRLTLSKGPY